MQKISIILMFALACTLGAWLRYFIVEILTDYGEILAIWAVFIVNILGCFGFGFLWPWFKLRKILLVGFMASFTTFSSYIFDVYLFLQAQDWFLLFWNGFMQLIVGFVALQLGFLLNKKVITNKVKSPYK